MDIRLNKDIKNQIVLINPYIHEKANLSREDFIEKIEFIKELRTEVKSNYLTFYITSIKEYNNLIKFYDLVNKGIFDFKNEHVFSIAIKPKLYEWFKNTTLEIIQKQIICWLAGQHYFIPKLRNIQEEQLYPPLFEEIQNIIELYYKKNNSPDFNKLFNDSQNIELDLKFEQIQKCKAKYLEVCKKYYNSTPPEFLKRPFDYENLTDWGVNEDYNFEIIISFLTHEDWNRIINNNSQDNMKRAESIEELFIKWKHIFSTFDKRKNFVYSLFINNDSTNKTNSIIKLREDTPKEYVNHFLTFFNQRFHKNIYSLLFEGKQLEEKINFEGSQAQLGTYLGVLYDLACFSNSINKNELEVWISENFQCNLKDCNINTIHDVVSSKYRKLNCQNPIIELHTKAYKIIKKGKNFPISDFFPTS